MGDSREPTDDQKIILVTGFGPFAGHNVNASWEAVKELSKIGLQESEDLQLLTKEIPVTYNAVKANIPQLWEDLKPYLVVHVGVSHLAQELTLEKVAHNDGYVKIDADGKKNESSHCCPGGQCKLKSELKIDIACDIINKNPCDIMAVASTDAGRYLCEYIYYTSLNQDPSRAVFIHVPPLGKPYSAQQLALGLKVAIEAFLKQLS